MPRILINSFKRLALNLRKQLIKIIFIFFFFLEKSRFMKSEVELDEAIQELNIVATAPDLYNEFIALGTFGSVIKLLAHENIDIVIDVINLLNELFDPFVFEQSKEALVIISAFVFIFSFHFSHFFAFLSLKSLSPPPSRFPERIFH